MEKGRPLLLKNSTEPSERIQVTQNLDMFQPRASLFQLIESSVLAAIMAGVNNNFTLHIGTFFSIYLFSCNYSNEMKYVYTYNACKRYH